MVVLFISRFTVNWVFRFFWNCCLLRTPVRIQRQVVTCRSFVTYDHWNFWAEDKEQVTCTVIQIVDWMMKEMYTLPLTRHIQYRPLPQSCYDLRGSIINKWPVADIIKRQQSAQLEKFYLSVVYPGMHWYTTIITAIKCYCYGSHTNAQQDEPHQGNFCYSGMHSPVRAQLLLFIQLETARFSFIHTKLNISSVH